jgi:hypothetical protein
MSAASAASRVALLSRRVALLLRERSGAASKGKPLAPAWQPTAGGLARIRDAARQAKVAWSNFKQRQDQIQDHHGAGEPELAQMPPSSAPPARDLGGVSTRGIGAALSARDPLVQKLLQHGVHERQVDDLDFLYSLHPLRATRGEALRVPSWGVDAGDDSYFLVQKSERRGGRQAARSPDPNVFQRS